MNGPGPKPRETDEAYLSRMIRDNKYITDRGGFKTVKAAIIPTACKKMRVVPVAVRPCNTKKLQSIDVVFRAYVSMMLAPETLSYNMDEFMTVVDQYPINSPILEPLNELLPTFSGASNLEVKGNILVVKHERESGCLVSIEQTECYFIQRVVVDTFLSTGQTPLYPPEPFPLCLPLEPPPEDEDPAEPSPVDVDAISTTPAGVMDGMT